MLNSKISKSLGLVAAATVVLPATYLGLKQDSEAAQHVPEGYTRYDMTGRYENVNGGFFPNESYTTSKDILTEDLKRGVPTPTCAKNIQVSHLEKGNGPNTTFYGVLKDGSCHSRPLERK